MSGFHWDLKFCRICQEWKHICEFRHWGLNTVSLNERWANDFNIYASHYCDPCCAERDRQSQIECANRRAKLMGAEGTFTLEEWENLCAQYDNQCVRCGDKDKLFIDHVHPLSKGGSNDISNLEPLCEHCNAFKKDRNMDFRPKNL